MAKVPDVTLSSCEKTMPVIGMGTSSFPPADLETTKTAIIEAIKAGYRHFDTAFAYGSEKPLGEAIAEALTLGLIMSRDELFITTKLWSSSAERDQIVPACKMSLQTIHSTPVEKDAIEPLDVKGVWEGMEECVKLGLTKGIGVSNFSCKKLEEVLAVATIPPAVNQVELNPTWQQKGLREFCKAKGIEITAFCPLGANNTKWGDNRVMDSDVLAEIAKPRGKTVAQVALRWVYEQGVSLVAKSYNKERMKQNLQIFDWSLSEEELEKISQIPQRKAVTLASIFGPHDLVLELDAEV
nr:D-galacturonate reductase-like isoform X2 [Coffea arabica]